jgi:hypothetical protein
MTMTDDDLMVCESCGTEVDYDPLTFDHWAPRLCDDCRDALV